MWVDRIVKDKKCEKENRYNFFMKTFKLHAARSKFVTTKFLSGNLSNSFNFSAEPTAKIMNIELLPVGRVVYQYFDRIRYIKDSNQSQKTKEFNLLGMEKFMHFVDFYENLFQITSTNISNKGQIMKKMYTDILGVEELIAGKAGENETVMDIKFAQLNQNHPELSLMNKKRAACTLDMFFFYKIAYFSFFILGENFIRIYYDIADTLTGGYTL